MEERDARIKVLHVCLGGGVDGKGAVGLWVGHLQTCGNKKG